MIIELSRKKLLLVGSFIVVLIAIPLTVYLAQRQQETQSSAADVAENKVIVSVAGKDYTKTDIRNVANEQYAQSAVDDQALKDAAEILIERKILDAEAARLGINVDSAQVSNRAAEEGESLEEAKYELLKSEIILTVVKSRKTLSIGFWSPTASDQENLDASEKELASQLTSEGRAALSEIETKLKNEEGIIEVADSIVEKYPVLKGYLAVNGYRYEDLSEEEKQSFGKAEIIEYGDANMDQSVIDGIFSMELNEVKKFEATKTNAGGSVYKILEKGNDSGPASYDVWLSSKRSALVIQKASL